MLNRLNVGVTALIRTSDVSYVPSLAEVALSLGVFAAAGLAFLYLIENFRVFEDTPARQHVLSSQREARSLTAMGRAWVTGPLSGGRRLSLIVVATASIAMGTFSAEAFEGIELAASPVHAPRGVAPARTVLVLNGDRDDDAVRFPHEDHHKRLGDRASCARCHHQNLPGEEALLCHACHSDMSRKSPIFDHGNHVAHLGDKWSCERCHDAGKAKNRATAVACVSCHRDDMGLTSRPYNYYARSYTDSMHGLCVTCHREQDQKNDTQTAECRFCHTH